MFEKLIGDVNTKKKKDLQIIIVGCGKVGSTLIERLANNNNIITIIDTDASRVNEISSTYDVMAIVGNGGNKRVLEDANIKTADLFIAVTASDELNVLSCAVASACNPNCSIVARVSSPDYTNDMSFLRDKLGLTMTINPNYETAIEASRILTLPTALEVNTFAHNQADMIKLKVTADCSVANLTIAEYGQSRKTPITICAIERKGEVLIPYGALKIELGDTIYFVTARKYTKAILHDLYPKSSKTIKTCMIIGGSRTSYYLARRLISQGIAVKIIERDHATCEKLSELLPKATIIHGDGTNADLLEEEGLSTTDSFVPFTGIDEENILLTLHAKKFSNAKIITKIDRNTFRAVINELDLDSVLYPKYITSEAIIAYARAKKASMGSNIESLYNICDNKAEAIEFAISDNKKITNTPLKELPIKKNVVICFINHNGHILIPTGDDIIQNGDSIMIATTEEGLDDVNDILTQ